MIAKKYNNIYTKQIKHTNVPLNIITKVFLSRFSPIKKNFKNKKLLDFSCGSGAYLNFFLNLGFKVYGSEISNVIVNQLKKKFNKVQFSIAKNNYINFPNRFFNFFIAIHSIYYSENESESFDDTIKLVKSKIKKNGFFIFTIPRIEQKHLKFKHIKNNLYKIVKDKYNLRKNSFFFLFQNDKEIRKQFMKFFKVIEIGLIYSDFKNLEENYYLCIMQKR
jgi:SAM-dependent methyltransferase